MSFKWNLISRKHSIYSPIHISRWRFLDQFPIQSENYRIQNENRIYEYFWQKVWIQDWQQNTRIKKDSGQMVCDASLATLFSPWSHSQSCRSRHKKRDFTNVTMESSLADRVKQTNWLDLSFGSSTKIYLKVLGDWGKWYWNYFC